MQAHPAVAVDAWPSVVKVASPPRGRRGCLGRCCSLQPFVNFVLRHIPRLLYLPIMAVLIVAMSSVVVIPVFFNYRSTTLVAEKTIEYFCAIQTNYSKAACDEYIDYFKSFEQYELQYVGATFFESTIGSVDPLTNVLKLSLEGRVGALMDRKGTGWQFDLLFDTTGAKLNPFTPPAPNEKVLKGKAFIGVGASSKVYEHDNTIARTEVG